MTSYPMLSVNDVRSKIHNKNMAAHRSHSSSESILEKRRKIRLNWSVEKRANYEKFLKTLHQANENYIWALKDEISRRTQHTLEKNVGAKGFTIWNPQDIECSLYGFKPFTIYRGFWNSDTRTHDRLPHLEAGITKPPLEQVKKELLPLGYDIHDVSDRNKSFNVVIHINLIEN